MQGLQLVNERWKFLTIQLVDTYKKPLERHLACSAQVYLCYPQLFSIINLRL